MALGHTVIFQGWNDGNPGNRDKPAARVLGGSQPGAFGQCFSPAFLPGPCTAGSVKLKVCFQRSGLKAGYTSATSSACVCFLLLLTGTGHSFVS